MKVTTRRPIAYIVSSWILSHLCPKRSQMSHFCAHGQRTLPNSQSKFEFSPTPTPKKNWKGRKIKKRPSNCPFATNLYKTESLPAKSPDIRNVGNYHFCLNTQYHRLQILDGPTFSGKTPQNEPNLKKAISSKSREYFKISTHLKVNLCLFILSSGGY